MRKVNALVRFGEMGGLSCRALQSDLEPEEARSGSADVQRPDLELA